MSQSDSTNKSPTGTPSRVKARRPGEAVFAFLLFIGSLFVFYQAYNISGFTSISSPGAVPMLAGAFLLASSIFISVTTFKSGTAVGFFPQMAPPLLLVFGLLTIGYITLIDTVGFVLSSALFLFLSILYLHRKGVVMSLLISVNTLAVIYIVFRVVFKVILPDGSLFE